MIIYHIIFLLVNFQLHTDSPSQILRFYRKITWHLALLKDRYLKKMLLKKQKLVALSPKSIGQNNSCNLFENNFRFLRGYYTLYQKLACFVLYLKIINTFLENDICIL